MCPIVGRSLSHYEAQTDREMMLTQIHTDIDCSECLEEVRDAIASLPNVSSVEEHSSGGDFVVSHTADRNLLEQVVLKTGHRLQEADNGEIEMIPASVSLFDACSHGVSE